VVLDAGEKAEEYTFTPKISDELKEVFASSNKKYPQEK